MMKKILYFFIAAALLCGCEKEENGGDPVCPVTEVSLPASSAENPVIPGSSVTIQGKGFTSGSEIWFRSMTKSTDVQATVIGVTASAITFTAPEVYGSQSVLLKQDGNEWTLGTLVFANQSTDPGDPTDPEYLPRKISQVKVIFKDESKGDYTQLYTYSYDADNRLSTMTVTDLFEGEEETLTINYAYAESKITSKGEGNGFIQSLEESYELTEGRVSKYVRTTISGGKYAEEGIKTIQTLNPRYNAEGYLVAIDGKEVCSGDPEEAYESILTDQYTFTEGIFNKYVSKASTTDSYGQYGSSSEIEFAAGPANNLNIDVFGIDWMGEEMYSAPLFLLNVGGKRSAQLPAKYQYQYADIDEDGNVSKDDNQTKELEYTMDGDYITSIKTYIAGELETIVEIIYED